MATNEPSRTARLLDRGKWFFVGTEIAVVYLLLIGATALVGEAPSPALERPGTFLVMGYDRVAAVLAPELSGRAFWTGYAAYLYGLATVGGAVLAGIRKAL